MVGDHVIDTLHPHGAVAAVCSVRRVAPRPDSVTIWFPLDFASFRTRTAAIAAMAVLVTAISVVPPTPVALPGVRQWFPSLSRLIDVMRPRLCLRSFVQRMQGWHSARLN